MTIYISITVFLDFFCFVSEFSGQIMTINIVYIYIYIYIYIEREREREH